MKNISIILLAVLSISFRSCPAQQKESHFEPIAVVELFTSEGCSSCPSADIALTKLTADADKEHKKIFTLAFHVDYWNRLGWKDTFSNSHYSDRQRQYAEIMNLPSVYTPQMIVNGTEQFVGSDISKLHDEVAKALSMNATSSFAQLNVIKKEANKLSLHYELKGNIKDCEIHFALISKHVSTNVKRGENAGHLLAHTDVVREFITRPAADQSEITINTPLNDWTNLHLIAYVQRTTDLKIIAAAEIQP